MLPPVVASPCLLHCIASPLLVASHCLIALHYLIALHCLSAFHPLIAPSPLIVLPLPCCITPPSCHTAWHCPLWCIASHHLITVLPPVVHCHWCHLPPLHHLLLFIALCCVGFLPAIIA